MPIALLAGYLIGSLPLAWIVKKLTWTQNDFDGRSWGLNDLRVIESARSEPLAVVGLVIAFVLEAAQGICAALLVTPSWTLHWVAYGAVGAATIGRRISVFGWRRSSNPIIVLIFGLGVLTPMFGVLAAIVPLIYITFFRTRRPALARRK